MSAATTAAAAPIAPITPSQSDPPTAVGAPAVATQAATRKRTPLLLAALTATAAIVAGSGYLVTRGQESTDDAQVEGRRRERVGARVAGQVLRVLVEDNQLVEAGDVLVELDPADYAARADVAARRSGRGARAAAMRALGAGADREDGAGDAGAGARRADGGSVVAARRPRPTSSRRARTIAAAESRRDAGEARARARADAHRRPARCRRRELDARQTAARQRRRRRSARRARGWRRRRPRAQRLGRRHRAGARPARRGGDGQRAGRVGRGGAGAGRGARRSRPRRRCKHRRAQPLVHHRARRRRGVVSRRTVEAGQLVSPERPLLALVPLDDVWVVANFKEDQLAEMQRRAAGDSPGRHLRPPDVRTATSTASPAAPARASRFCRPTTPPATSPRSCSACPCSSASTTPPAVELRPGMSADVTVDTASQVSTSGACEDGHRSARQQDARSPIGVMAAGADGDDRHLDRQRRAQRHPRELRHAARPDRLGLDRLHDGEHRDHPDDGLVPAPLRLPPLLRRRRSSSSPPPARCAGWRGTCRRWWSSACCRASAAARSSRRRRASCSRAIPSEEHGMAGALFGLGAITGPLLGPTIGGYLDRRGRAGTGSSSSTCRSASSPPGVAWTQIEEPGFVADKRPVDRFGIALLADRHGVAAVRARRGQPRRLVREPADHAPRRRRRHRARHLHRPRARDADIRSSTCACSRTAATRRRRRSTSSSASRSSPARCSCRSTAARSCTTARSTSAACSCSAAGSRSSSCRSSGAWSRASIRGCLLVDRQPAASSPASG